MENLINPRGTQRIRGTETRTKKNSRVLCRAAAVAASFSVPSEGILNKNKLILNEAQANWEIGKILVLK